MKSLLTAFVFLLVICSAVLAQSPAANPADSLYSRALFASIEKMDASYRSFSNTDYHHMIVMHKDGVTERLPTHTGEYQVEYLDWSGLKDRYKRSKREFPALQISAMKNVGSRLEIIVSVYWLSFKGNNSYQALSDWSSVYFRFDCERQEFVIDEIKLGGI